jgi:hypothetical protein
VTHNIIDPPNEPEPVLFAPGRVLLQFDSRRTISFEEGNMHTATFGTTGAGKTLALILPILINLIAAGFAGLVIDIKGNITRMLRALCTYFKRQDDVVELGVGPEATRFNFLANLDSAALYEFFNKLTLRDVGSSHNMSFYKAGIKVATALAQVCRCLATRDERFTPSLETVAELLSNFPLCADLFKALVSLADTPEEARLINQIKNDCFHPCLWTPYNSRTRSENYDEQAEWRSYSTRNPLSALLQAPGIKHGFCSAKHGALNLEDLIYNQKKIVVLRFGSRSGIAGEDLTRFCLEAFYQAVFARGLELPAGEKTFAVMDEFQDFADFSSNNALNDNAFVAKSREFNNIFVAASQSVSALITRGYLPAKIESFINNCNNRIFMYCDDPWTQEVSRRHSIISLTRLGPGEAVTVKFNMDLRKHECGLETLQIAHDESQARLAAGEALGPIYNDEIARRALKPEADDPLPSYHIETALEEMGPLLELPKTEAEKRKIDMALEAKKAQSKKEVEMALMESELRGPFSPESNSSRTQKDRHNRGYGWPGPGGRDDDDD